MKYQIIRHQHVFESEKFFPQCHASTLALLPGGAVAAAWFAGKHEKAPDVAIWFSRCENGVWSDPVIIADRPNIPCWNPVLYSDGGKLTLFYKIGLEIPEWQTFVKQSDDGGLTWSEEKELVPGGFGGRGPVKNKCITLRDARLLAPASVETQDAWDCFVDISDDGGQTWQRSENVPVCREAFTGLGVIQPTLWQDDSGRIHMLMRSSEGAILKSHSDTGGMHWSTAVKTNLPNNNCGIDVTRLDDGRLVLVYNPVSGNWAARSPIAFAISEDNGEHWSEPQILDHVPCDRNIEKAEFSYPAVVSSGNDVYISYTWKRRTIAFWHIRLAPQKKQTGKMRDGVWVTMVTPFTADKQVDYPALEALVEWYIENRVDGLFAVCQSSEMFYLSLEERVEVARFVVEKAAGRVPVVASGHISDSLDEQIAELRAVAATGVQAVVLVSNRLAGQSEGEDVWKKNAQAIMDAIPDCDFGIYECPYPYKRVLSPELLGWCAQTGRFTFLKDTCCDMDMIRAKLEAIQGTGLKLFNANSATILDSMRAGASGFCGVMANFHPGLYTWLTHHWQNDRQKAEVLQHFATVASLMELQMYPNNAKYHLSLCGVPMGIHTRSKDDSQWNRLREIETEAMLQSWRNFVRMV